MHQVATRRPTFLQKSPSVASLVAWKEKFETYAGKFTKKPSFVSYSEADTDGKSTKQDLASSTTKGDFKYIPENDLPPGYNEAIKKGHPPPPPEKKLSQDFTALEHYLKKRLSVRKKSGCRLQDQLLETEKVFRWLHELPEGDNLEEFLEAYGIPTKGVDIEELKSKLRVFLKERLTQPQVLPPTSGSPPAAMRRTSSESALLEVDGNDQESTDTDPSIPSWKRQLESLEELAESDNLEKWLEGLDVPYFKPIPETKEQIRKYLMLQKEREALAEGIPKPDPKVKLPVENPPVINPEEFAALVPKWKEVVEKMKDLKNEEDLDQWLESLDVPHNIPKAKVKAEIRKFFMHETFDNFAGKSPIFQEQTLAKELWEKFEDASVLKQVAMISGTTAVLGLIAVLSTTMLSFAFPPALAVNPFFTEVFAQYFIQRQEVAFNLLNFHAQTAKPLSTAWAKQYILWKYC